MFSVPNFLSGAGMPKAFKYSSKFSQLSNFQVPRNVSIAILKGSYQRTIRVSKVQRYERIVRVEVHVVCNEMIVRISLEPECVGVVSEETVAIS